MVKTSISRSCTMRFPTSSSRRAAASLMLCCAQPRFVTAGCKPAKPQSRRWHQINQHCAASTVLTFLGCPAALNFQRFSLWHRALATVVRALFLPHVLRTLIWCKQFEVQAQIKTFCQKLSQIEACNRGNRDPAWATPWSTLPKKNNLALCPNMFPSMNSRAFEVLHFPTAWW